MERLDLPENLEILSEYAFKGCASLKTVVFPESLTHIGGECFKDCSALEEANLPDGLRILGKYAFTGCSSLRSVHLSKHLSTIEAGVFNNCVSLQEVNISESVTSIRDFAFENTGIRELVLPSSIETLEGCAFGIVPTMLVHIPYDAPVFASGDFLNMENLPYFRVFDPNGTDYIWPTSCPRCHDHHISQRKVHKLFSIAKAFLFMLVFPPAFLLGFLGKDRIEYTCNVCGQTWYKKPRDFLWILLENGLSTFRCKSFHALRGGTATKCACHCEQVSHT